MKKVMLIAFLCSLVAGTLGFSHGRDEVLTDKEKQKLIAARLSKIVFIDDRAYLSISLPESTRSWLCDVDTNTVRYLDSKLAIKFREAKPFILDTGALEAFIGGTTAWKVTDVIKEVKSSNNRAWVEPLAFIASAASGYYIGHYFGVKLTRDNLKEELVPILENSSGCKEIKKLVVSLLFNEKFDIIMKNEKEITLGHRQPKEGFSREDIRKIMLEEGNPSQDFQSHNFKVLIYLATE